MSLSLREVERWLTGVMKWFPPFPSWVLSRRLLPRLLPLGIKTNRKQNLRKSFRWKALSQREEWGLMCCPYISELSQTKEQVLENKQWGCISGQQKHWLTHPCMVAEPSLSLSQPSPPPPETTHHWTCLQNSRRDLTLVMVWPVSPTLLNSYVEVLSPQNLKMWAYLEIGSLIKLKWGH